MAKRRRVKVRITTSIDRDVLMWLKVRALETRMGYQTLMNRMLTEAIAREAKEASAPAPVSRSEFESVSETLKELETRMEGLKKAVQAKRPSKATREKKKSAAHGVSLKRSMKAQARPRPRA